jgi:hypothetical protein
VLRFVLASKPQSWPPDLRLLKLGSPPKPQSQASTLAAVCVAVFACAIVGGASARSSSKSSPVAGTAVVRYGSSAAIGAQHLHRYSYVILGKSAHKYVKRIKRLSPKTKVLGYDPAPELVDNCVPASWVCSGITYQEARAHDARHPNDLWILRSASGQSLINPHYRNEHLANVGSLS